MMKEGRTMFKKDNNGLSFQPTRVGSYSVSTYIRRVEAYVRRLEALRLDGGKR